MFGSLEQVVTLDGELKQRLHLAKKENLPNNEKTTFEEFKKLKEPTGQVVCKIPCGHCIGCRMDKSREWANRCVLELPDHTESWFVTLTYNDEHLPYNSQENKVTHEVITRPTLVKSDVQLFLKRLRKRFADDTIRFFMCGEYGEKNHRPHYHLILFGAPLSSNLRYLTSKNGNAYFSSLDIEELWSYGFNYCTAVTWNTCAYVARYTLKKVNSAPFFKDGIALPEFINMSRRPGIGFNFFEQNCDDIYSNDWIRKGFTNPIKPPKYYDRLYQATHLVEMLAIKERRREFAEFAEQLPATDLDEFTYRELQAFNKQQTAHTRLPRR